MNYKQTTTFLFSEISNNFRLLLEKNLVEIGLHSGQIFVLLELWQEDGLNQVTLANRLKITSPTVNKMIKSLIKSNFIKTSPCENDGRIKIVNLTKKGKDYEELVKEKWKEFEYNFFSGINETEKLIFFQLLEKLKTPS